MKIEIRALADPAKGRYFVAERADQVVGQIMHADLVMVDDFSGAVAHVGS